MIGVRRVAAMAMVNCALAVGLAACGVPVDDQPEPIDVPALDSMSAALSPGVHA